jgi:hypothetical protein
MDFTNYKFRCSALGRLLSKSGKFTDGNKTYIEEVFAGEVHNTKKEVSSKYFEKGLFEEESGITLLQNTLHKNQLILKNKERKSNDFIHGEADCIVNGVVYDIKNAWDAFTFENSELTHDYKWQLVGYAWLWKLENAALFFCLNDTPEHLILDEEKKLFYRGNYGTFENEDFIKDCELLRQKHTHSYKPLEERFKVWELSITNEDIETLQGAILIARKYLIELQNERDFRLEKNRRLIGNLKIA